MKRVFYYKDARNATIQWPCGLKNVYEPVRAFKQNGFYFYVGKGEYKGDVVNFIIFEPESNVTERAQHVEDILNDVYALFIQVAGRNIFRVI